MDFLYRFGFVTLCLLSSGCVSTQHDWGEYSTELYQYYQSPDAEQRLEFQEELTRVFERAESKGLVPAPGLYAEYGTLMMESENYTTAVEYYRKEKAAWPESSKLMDALISSLERQAPEANPTPASLAEEKGDNDE